MSQTSPDKHILVVDDDSSLREQIVAYLKDHGYAVHAAADAEQMERALAASPIDLIVLDIMLPGEDGLSICRRLAKESGPGIIMVSALGEEVDRVLGLEIGADDYLSKPCSPRELLARVKAVLRRRDERQATGGAGTGGYRFMGFTLNAARRQLLAPDGTAIMLTNGELALLTAFLERPGRILSRDELLEMVHGDTESFDRAIDVQISRLRRKLNGYSPQEIIRTYRGAGYLFEAKVARS